MSIPLKVRDARQAGLPGEGAVDMLERLAMMAAQLCRAADARLMLNIDGRSRVVASHGAHADYHTHSWDLSKAPFAPDELIVVEDLQAPGVKQGRSYVSWQESPRFLLRLPVLIDETQALSLVVTNPEPLPKPGPVDLALLGELGDIMRQQYLAVRELLIDPAAHVTVALTFEAMCRRCSDSSIAGLILSADQDILFANLAAQALAGLGADEITGKKPHEVTDLAIDSLELLFRHAIEAKLSTPAVDLTVAIPGGGHRTFNVRASPFSPIGTDDYFLQVAVRDVTALSDREASIEDRIDEAIARKSEAHEPTAQFLLDTLVARKALRARNGITYLTLRSWRNPIRDYQIKALRALKAVPPAGLASTVAAEMQVATLSLIGASVFKAIVPVPCGHSSPENCFSAAIACELGRLLGLPVIHALAAKKQRGKSHPKTNVTRPPLELKHPMSDPVLLIDDVATSGAHLEEAVKLLKKHSGSVMPIAWIGGNTAAADGADDV